jgi:ABC-2 type transport system ATP-binding protein
MTRTEDELAMRGSQGDCDAYIADLIGEGLSLRKLTTDDTPLEELFFMLTERDVDGASRGDLSRTMRARP